ncbi:hypothetical protein [Aquimarina mytili]|uniref:HTH domain-containing protein n=1 Tax=Aquimarina mytili TaxID=874423 RepID=A0A936ZXJ8_9FLAO|nr:hypothetical protein [Aquimarina mytili]MBL0686152.1 hypothetical protein [Aquimarina mytili]
MIKRIDQLIRLQATGTPETLACRLNISRTKLYRILDMMKSLNAPIHYDPSLPSFVYTEPVGFLIGFFSQQQLNDTPIRIS